MNFPEFKLTLPSSPFQLYNEPVEILVKFYKEHLQRDIADGRLTPAEVWIIFRGLLVSASQSYAAICILLSDKRPKPLMLQAGILNRSLLETLGNVLALCEAPKSRTRILAREAYKNMALTLQAYKAQFETNPKWKEYLNVYAEALAIWEKELRLPRHRIKNPSSIPEEWPTPGIMIHGSKRRNQKPFLRGSRR